MKTHQESKSYSVKDFENLETLRAEVNLQAHLMKSELKQKFENVEKDWDKLNSHFKQLRSAAKHASHEVSAATALLAETVEHGYTEIKQSLKTK